MCLWVHTDGCRTGAADVLNEYFDSIGGRPTKGQKRKGRQSVGGTKPESATPAAASAKRVKQEKEWSPPPGSWEHEVSYVDTVEEKPDPKTGQLTKFAYLCWNNQKKTMHPLHHIYQKCPQKVRLFLLCRTMLANDTSQMLAYYEKHLVFKHNLEVDEVPIGMDGSNGHYPNDDDGNNVIMNDSF
jgi:chromobox protein 1